MVDDFVLGKFGFVKRYLRLDKRRNCYCICSISLVGSNNSVEGVGLIDNGCCWWC